MRHHPDVFLILIFFDYLKEETVSGGQFIWGGCLLKCNGGVYKGELGSDGNGAGRAMA